MVYRYISIEGRTLTNGWNHLSQIGQHTFLKSTSNRASARYLLCIVYYFEVKTLRNVLIIYNQFQISENTKAKAIVLLTIKYRAVIYIGWARYWKNKWISKILTQLVSLFWFRIVWTCLLEIVTRIFLHCLLNGVDGSASRSLTTWRRPIRPLLGLAFHQWTVAYQRNILFIGVRVELWVYFRQNYQFVDQLEEKYTFCGIFLFWWITNFKIL